LCPRLMLGQYMHGSQKNKSLYYFRVLIDGVQLHDSDGLDFEDLEEVWQEGAQSACEIIHSMHGRIEDDLDWQLEVSDTSGKVIYRFTFKAERL
jgi:hypothetical protein